MVLETEVPIFLTDEDDIIQYLEEYIKNTNVKYFRYRDFNIKIRYNGDLFC